MTSSIHSLPRPKESRLRLVSVISVLIAGTGVAMGANVWDGGGGDGNWGTTTNWDNNAVPTNSSSLTFGGDLQLNSVNNVGSITAVTGLTFDASAGAFILSGNALALNGNITNESSNVQTIGMNLTLANTRVVQGGAGVTLTGTFTNSGGNRTLVNDLSSGVLTMGAINLSEGATSRGLTIQSNGSTVINGVIANGGGSTAGFLAKAGNGNLSLTRANTFGGGTTVIGGTLQLDFGAAGAPVSNILYNSVAANTLSMQGSAANTGTSVTTRLSGADSASNTQTFSSLLIGRSTVDRGTATHLNLVGGDSGSVAVTLSAASNPLLLYGGSTLDIALGSSDSLTITNGTTSNGLVGVGTNVGLSTLVTLNGSDWASLDSTTKQVVAATYSTSFATTGASNLDVQSSGTLTGTSVNTLRLNQAADTTVNINSANTTVHGILVTAAVGNHDVTIAGQSIRGANNQALTVFQNNTSGDLVISSTIVNQGTSTLIKSGDGRMVLQAANTYTGRTFINEGTVFLDGGSLSTGIVTVAGDARLGGLGSVGGETYISADGRLQAGNGMDASGSFTLSNNLTLGDGSVIELVLGAGGAHSSLVRTGGTWIFDAEQAFEFSLNNAAVGSYTNLISGLTGSEVGLSTVANWTITNSELLGTFSYNGAGGVDLALTAIPEPSPAMLLSALIGVYLILFRRNRRLRGDALK